MTVVSQALTSVLTQQQPEPAKYIDPSTVGPGLIGFIAFVFLGVATILLVKSMNRQLKRIDFDEEAPVRPVNAPFSRNPAGSADQA